MAEELKITVQGDLGGNLAKSKNHFETLKDQGGFVKDSNAKKTAISIIQELETLTEISKPTAKQLSRIDALFNELSDILLKASNRVKTTTDEFKRLEKELEEQTGLRNKAVKKREKILDEGRINKKTGKYALFKTDVSDEIARSGIRNAHKRDIKTADTFFSKFDEEGKAKEGEFEDPAKAQLLYDQLKQKQLKNAEALDKLTTEIADYDEAIEKTRAKMNIESGSSGSLAGEIVGNKIDVNTTVEDTKAAIRNEKRSKDTTVTIGEPEAFKAQSTSLGKAFKQFSIYTVALRAVKKALGDAVQTVKELDKYLTEQAMVTGKTREQTYKLVGSYQALALECGASTKEVAQVATEYMKQGKTIADSLTLTEAAVKAAKVARVSVGDSVNYLTTALNGFRLSADQAMAVSDKFAAVAAASATDYDELAIALSKVASQANLAGMSIDYTTALLTKGLETTREAPETMGTALKTIIARMRELSDYGETLGGDTDINKVESQLAYVGIALRDTSGELRSTEEVLDELGHKWDDLNKNQQAAIAKALAGTRQQSRLIAMMEDYERVTELQQISARSAGATSAQAATYLEGMEGAMNKIHVAWEKLVMNLTSSDAIVGIFQTIGKVISGIADLFGDIKLQIPVFTLLGTIALNTLLTKQREYSLAKQMRELEQQRAIEKQQERIDQLKQNIAKTNPNGEFAAANKLLHGEKDEKGNIKTEADVAAFDEKFKDNKKLIKAKEKEKEAQDSVDEAQHEYDKAAASIKDKVVLKEEEVTKSEDEELKIEQEILKQNAIIKEEQAKIDAEVRAKELADLEAIRLSTAQRLADERKITLEKLQQSGASQEEITKAQGALDDANQDVKNLTESKKQADEKHQKAKENAKDSKDKIKAANDEKKKQQDKLKKQKDITKQKKKELQTTKDLIKKEERNLNAAKQKLELAKDNTAETRENVLNNVALSEAGDGQLSAALQHMQLLKDQASQLGFIGRLMGNINQIQKAGQKIQQLINIAHDAYQAKLRGEKVLIKQNDKAQKQSLGTIAMKAFGSIVGAFAQLGPWGVALGIATGIAVAAAIGIGIAAGAGAFSAKNHRENAADEIKKISAEVYKLEESAQAIDSTADHFDALDKKVLKTKEDIQAMNEDLEKIGETMSEEDPNDGKNDTEYDKEIAKITKGKSEAEYYAGLTDEEKLEFARQKADLQRKEADRLRDKQVQVLQNLGGGWEDRDGNGIDEYYTAEQNQRHLLETDKEVRDAFYAYNKNQLYDYIDALKEGSDAITAISEEEALMLEGVTQNLLDNMDAWDAYQYAQNPEKVRELADTLRSVQVNGKQALEVLQGISDDEETEISLKERVAAYNALKDSLDETTRAAFMMEYQEFEFWSTLSDKALDLLDTISLSNDAINDIYSAYDKLNKILEEDLGKTAAQLDADTYKTMIDSVWDSLDEDFSNFEDVLKSTFGSIIGDSEDAWNALVSSIGDEIATTILDMGQEMEAFGNTINSFYEKASEWNELKESERMEFIADNSELFSGEGGAALLEAFESGNYNAIEEALGAQMAEKQEQQLQQIRRTLAIEEARVGEDRNEAYIAALKQYEQHLMDTNNLYKASLDLRLEQEEAQIEKYKEYLEEQQEALTESLEKRKEAYEKYFESINQEQEDEDYEEEATRLIDNITKLSSSTNADAMQQTAELQQELENLEEERLKELRERAQEAIIENIDTTIEEINDKFDKLLDSNQALLLAMQGELDNPLEFMTDMIVSQAGKGTTALELEQYLQDLQGTYGNIIGNDVFENMSVREENGQLILNVNGQEITLNQGDEQSIFTAVMDALRAVGLK